MPFDYTLDFKKINFRDQPEFYRIGKGEQGVLLVEPYKSEILPYWRFKSPEIARRSADQVYALFINYLAQQDFVGADMARKFLQKGYTRARRYANHKSGRKYAQNPQLTESKAAEKDARRKFLLPNQEDPVKAAAAAIFKAKWEDAKSNNLYKQLSQEHLAKFGK
ncbi:MAG: hypothetical protein JWQ14_1410 [Adhaeribacter sp.]|jgi:hypothetical protein|nr:hypothetical protein [Adhaeribacter sp.]